MRTHHASYSFISPKDYSQLNFQSQDVEFTFKSAIIYNLSAFFT